MQPLDKSLRSILEKTVKLARDTAETAARIALQQLGVGEPSAYTHLSNEERKLRRKLRAHGRQLGNGRDAKGYQALDRLIEEVAYEHWHRMLFARFLAENNLLMYPDPDDPVPVTLEECEDLAADEGAANGWELASRYASIMLPQIFRSDSPVFQLILPPEKQQKLERLVAELPIEVFIASDSLGWVYQFWQAKKKEEVNASEVKIGSRELPAVTQLFTEPYMVLFLLDNSLGAWWAVRNLSEDDLKNASSEEELRSKASIPGVPLKYLRFVKQEDGIWTPAAGTFDHWPDNLKELKTLDPCCGSGHFLVAAFMMLVPMRMELEMLPARDAVDSVLRENIHGLELDQRCVELAAFAIAFNAWKYPDAGGYRPMPELNIACSGLSVSQAKEEWKQLGLGKKNLTIALDWLYETFRYAPVLGSLLDPAKSDAIKLVEWGEIFTALENALKKEKGNEQQEAAVVAQGLAKSVALLTKRYHWVITNVPYLVRGKQTNKLQKYCEQHYAAAKNDLSTVFLARCLEFCAEGGTANIVLPQNWLFLTSYNKFRKNLLIDNKWHFIARLGPQAFQTPMWDFNVQLMIISRGNTAHYYDNLFSEKSSDHIIRGIDILKPRTATEKDNLINKSNIKEISQKSQLKNPDIVVSFDTINSESLLGGYARSLAGVDSGDSLRFMFYFWELSKPSSGWIFELNSVSKNTNYGGRSLTLFFEDGKGALAKCPGGSIRNVKYWGNSGVTVSTMGNIPASLSKGEAWCRNCACLVPKEKKYLGALWAYCSSELFNNEVRKINQKLRVAEATFERVPFDYSYWDKIAKEKYPNGLPNPYSDDPTQWIFHGHPCGSVVWDDDTKWTTYGLMRSDDTVLHVAVARLLGYHWPAELDANMELSDEQRKWENRCEVLLPYADDDGIVCIPPVRGELSAADRLMNLLVASYGDEWSGDILAQLVKSVDHGGKTLEAWLRDKFFAQHCRLFHHRPFIWHIWDGLRDGFSAFVNYHKLNHKNFETLIYTYLGDWINRQTQDIANGVDGAEERLAASEYLKKKLELILHGEDPHDIFVRWKPIEKQPIGWNPDLNDGVRLNIRPFMTVGDVKKKGAGVLRDKPNIKWSKDRGKDVESAPWYHMFKGDRINDHHLTIEEKQKAGKQNN